MSAVLVGRIVGRLFLSYLLVWVVMIVVSRFSFKLAFYRVHRWYGFILLVLVFLLGISSHLVSKGML